MRVSNAGSVGVVKQPWNPIKGRDGEVLELGMRFEKKTHAQAAEGKSVRCWVKIPEARRLPQISFTLLSPLPDNTSYLLWKLTKTVSIICRFHLALTLTAGGLAKCVTDILMSPLVVVPHELTSPMSRLVLRFSTLISLSC